MANADWRAIFTRVWLVPPSAWALFGGAVASLGFNLLIAVRTDIKLSLPDRVLFSIACGLFLVSALGFGWLCVMLEQYRAQGDLQHFQMTVHIPKNRRWLVGAFVTGLGTLIAGIILFCIP